jgi:glycerol-3-phosphate dehydrogenase subunit B
MHYDLIVIGMGLSGLMAAKTAVEMGKKTLIIGKGMGSLALFSNTIDLLGDLPKGTKLMNGLSQWVKGHPEHPYFKVGIERLNEALSSFLSLFPGPYSFQSLNEENALIPTGAGTFRPAYLLPVTMAAGAFLKEGDGLIAGFKGFKDFFAPYVGDQLRCRAITLPISDFFRPASQEFPATALARLMEKEEFRGKMGQEIKHQLHKETRVGFPAVLGIREPTLVMKHLKEILGVEIFEIPALPPSIPGVRIFNRFKEVLIQKGSTFLLGHSVSRAVRKERRCESIELFHPPITTSYSSDRYILASGRFLEGGLAANEEKIFEPLFDLPVHQPRSREDWFGKSFSSEHPIYQAGISTDSSLRPVDENGNRLLENVWVAGAILAHHDFINEKSKEGIEIATGYWAAKQALESL